MYVCVATDSKPLRRYVTLVMNDYPAFKSALLGALGIFSLSREKQ
jgi:hypothetical protein